ncbi:MAG: DM13 domain-containing protein [Alphaproteobacteria bacterium]
MALIAAGLGFVFAVRPVWSTSAQMQAEREATELRSAVAADVQIPSLASITWEEAVAGFMSSYDDEPILQKLSVFDGIDPSEFFKLRQGDLVAPTVPNDVTGTVKLYFIPGPGYFFFRLENFDIPVGPGYQIGLSSARAPREGVDIRSADYRFLSPLTRFQGSRNIIINPETIVQPDDKPTRFKSLVIWNAEFDVVIATATLN